AAAQEVGYYLIGPGRRALEADVGYRPPLSETFGRGVRRAGVAGYLLVVALITAVAMGIVAYCLRELSAAPMLLLLVALLLPASEVTIALLNNGITRALKPVRLPALDLAGVIPEEFRTLVAVPILLSTRAEIEEALNNLENEYLAGARGELYFALLADGVDAAQEVCEADDELIGVGRRGIAALNKRYGRGLAGDRFLWLCRKRKWNPQQHCWMGWERKRGKLHELNRLLRGAADTSFTVTAGEMQALPQRVRNVLVLDADTQLPHGAAEKLIGKISHPLNQPRIDARTRRVTAGY